VAWVVTGRDEVFTGPDGMMARPDGVEIKGVHNISAEEQSKLLADVAAYKARISFLESKLAELGFTEDASNDDSVFWAEELFEDRSVEQLENQVEDQAPMPTTPVFPLNEADRKGKRQMTDLELWRFEDRVDPQTTVQEQLDSALDWMNLADHFATTLAFENQALANKMDELRERLRHVERISMNAIEMEEELLEARALITMYEVMEDNTQELERQNINLKRCLTELAGEFDTYRDCTVFAVARARQYEAEFKTIQEEWVVNHRLRALLLTSWPVIDTMYDDKWPTDPSGGVAWKEIEDESNRWDVSEFNNIAPYGKKWPIPNEKYLDGIACVFCQNSFGPEGYYRLGTCACLYHPQCLIRGMVTIRRCQVCHTTFHPRLYQMFDMQDFMPTHVYYSIYDFPNVALE
jgi:hypothetical protein